MSDGFVNPRRRVIWQFFPQSLNSFDYTSYARPLHLSLLENLHETVEFFQRQRVEGSLVTSKIDAVVLSAQVVQLR